MFRLLEMGRALALSHSPLLSQLGKAAFERKDRF